MSINKDQLKQIREDMNACLASVAKKHGLKSLNAGNCSFDPAGCFTFKVEGVVSGGLDKEAALYESSRNLLGLPPLGTEFKTQSGINKIIGINTTGSKVIFERDGKRFNSTTEAVVSMCKRQGKF